MAYYILKPVREALILGEGSAELKTYMSAGQVVVLAFVVPLYAKLVASRPRMRLINTVTAFFTACLVAFYFLAQAGVPLAIPYFIWIGVFSLMIVAQFWSFANVIYDKSEGERLFAIVGFGASLGAVFGARVADRLIEPVGINNLLLLGAGGPRQPGAADQLRGPARAGACCRAQDGIRLEEDRQGDALQGLFARVQDPLPAVDGGDADARELGQHDRRVHPRPHRQSQRRRPHRLRASRRPERRSNHRRLLLEVLHLREHPEPGAPAVCRLADRQVPGGFTGRS